MKNIWKIVKTKLWPVLKDVLIVLLTAKEGANL